MADGVPMVSQCNKDCAVTAHCARPVSKGKPRQGKDLLRQFLRGLAHSVSSHSSSSSPLRQRNALLKFGSIAQSTKDMDVQSNMRKLFVGVGVAGMRWIEHRIPTNVKLVPITSDGILPEDTSKIEILITSGVEFPQSQLKAIFAAGTNIKVIQTLSAGVNSVVPYLQPHMTLCNSGGSHDVAVSEWCMAVILSRMRQLTAFWDAQQQSRWEPATKQLIQTGDADVGPMEDLEGKEVLIVGHGSIGSALQRRLLPFGANVTGIARTAREGVHSITELKTFLPKADIVVILVPLTSETHSLVDADFLQTMKQGAMLVNAGRGPQVDTQALLAALHSRHITAALDVTDPEPLPPDHPLWKAPGVFITPHIGGAVTRMRARSYKFVLEQLDRYLAGEPLKNQRLNGY